MQTILFLIKKYAISFAVPLITCMQKIKIIGRVVKTCNRKEQTHIKYIVPTVKIYLYFCINKSCIRICVHFNMLSGYIVGCRNIYVCLCLVYFYRSHLATHVWANGSKWFFKYVLFVNCLAWVYLNYTRKRCLD